MTWTLFSVDAAATASSDCLGIVPSFFATTNVVDIDTASVWSFSMDESKSMDRSGKTVAATRRERPGSSSVLKRNSS